MSEWMELQQEEDDEQSLNSSSECSDTSSSVVKTPKRNRPFKTNKNGLPADTQLALLQNVLEFQGEDNFKETCNKNHPLYGTPNSNKRKATQSKRYTFIKLHDNDPVEFLKLCSEFGVSIPSSDNKKTTSKPPSPGIQTSPIQFISPSKQPKPTTCTKEKRKELANMSSNGKPYCCVCVPVSCFISFLLILLFLFFIRASNRRGAA